MDGDATVRELEVALEDSVADLGGAGRVGVRDGQACLTRGGITVSVDVELLLGQWRVLASLLRQRKVEQTARDLLRAHDELGAPPSRPRGVNTPAVPAAALRALDAEVKRGAAPLATITARPSIPESEYVATAMGSAREAPPPSMPPPAKDGAALQALAAVAGPASSARAPMRSDPTGGIELGMPLHAVAPARREPPSASRAAAATSSTQAEREIEEAVREALGGFGVAGTATVHDRQIELFAGGAPVSIDLEALPDQWPLLPPEMRRRKVTEVARRLVAAQRGGAATGAARQRHSRVVVIPLGLVAVLGIAAFLGIRHYLAVRAANAPAPAGPPAETEEQARSRRARVCDASRKRLYAGASIGPFDTEGWYAELWLARAKPGEDLRRSAALVSLTDGKKLAPAADPALSSLADGTVEIVDGFTAEEAARSPSWSAVTVRFGGSYVGALLDPALRPRLLALSDRLADEVPADAAALFGRCGHLPHRDLGAWFRGPDPRGAAAALVYAAGMHAEAPAVNAAALGQLGGAGELDALRSAGGKLDTSGLGALVGPHSGSVAKSGKRAIAVTFPAGGGTRATQASRTVAKKLGVGVD